MRTTPAIPTAEPRKPSTFNLEAPGSAEFGPDDQTPIELTVPRIRVMLRGSSSPSVTWTVRFGPSVTLGGGTEIVVGGTVTTATGAGVYVTVLDNPVLPAGSWLWIQTTAQSGVVLSLTVSVEYA